jgi:hypothetical protein
MARVLVPVLDPDAAAAALSNLLAESPRGALDVTLLAIVEPLVPARVQLALTPERAESLAREAAARWLAPLEASLREAGVAHRAEVRLGRPRALIREAVERDDFDRVLLPTSRWPWGFARRTKPFATRSRLEVTPVA